MRTGNIVTCGEYEFDACALEGAPGAPGTPLLRVEGPGEYDWFTAVYADFSVVADTLGETTRRFKLNDYQRHVKGIRSEPAYPWD